MNIPPFIQGIGIGIAMAAPIGPISILCIRRSLAGGNAGIATALGVAIADGFYAVVAAFGLTAISSFLIDKKELLYAGGGLLLIVLGYKAFTSEPINITKPIKSRGFVTTLIQTVLLTLTNPMTILTFIAAFAAIGFEGKEFEWYRAIGMSLGVFCGSGTWYIGMHVVVSQLRTKMTPLILSLINTISGAFLMGFGIYFILKVLASRFMH